jgi:Na+-transporting NADH:ubiquinone oxidoreductase subunit A
MEPGSGFVTQAITRTIRIRSGLDLPLAGAPESSINTASAVRSVAVLGADYVGLKPRMLVEQGDHVSAGQPLFIDKRDPEVMYTAPASGIVSSIHRGARRALQSVVIELDEEHSECADYQEFANKDVAVLGASDICTLLYKSGLWSAFRTRPYSKIPQSGTRPHSIFVTAIDTQPLSADPATVVNKYEDSFACGLRVLARLTDGRVHVCTGPDWSGPEIAGEQLNHTQFAGSHPAGLPGTHIHHLDPVSAAKMVWHIGYQEVIAIGKLIGDGRVWNERVVALSGDGIRNPRLVETRLGANIIELTAGELQPSGVARLISGSVLNGRIAAGPDGFLGRYHLQVTALPEQSERSLFGWLISGGFSFAGLLARRSGQARAPFSTSQHGRTTALVPAQAFDKVLGLDMLAVPLLRALLIKDTDQAQQLGCLELDPEDLALCSFVCPGKNDYGAVLRVNLEQIEREG